ncbi:hypothetical protein [Flavobacterium psychrophilum]|nr:hypothetical protein [Flavobacterium psychrophilum]
MCWQQAKKIVITNDIFKIICIFDENIFVMDIQSRKIEFVQAFLKLQSEEVISQFESLLKKKSTTNLEQDSDFKPMSIKEFNDRIDKSESDFKNGRYKNTSELLKKYI